MEHISPEETLRSYRRAAVRFWERGRLIYLSALAFSSVLAFLLTTDAGPIGSYGPAHAFGILFAWTASFIGANVCYSIVHLLEFLVMGSRSEALFHSFRWVILAIGSMFGMAPAFVTA